MKVRSFLAFDIPDDVKDKLGSVIKDFGEKEKLVKWVKTENLHVTLKFFGLVEEELLLSDISKSIEDALRNFDPAVLRCQGIGVFPNWRYPRVFWAGLVGETDKVFDMQKMISINLEKFDLHKDDREFRLHLTIGRAKGSLKDSPLVSLAEGLGPVDFGEVRVERIVMYKSQLTKNGPVYTPLMEFGI